MVSEVSFPRFWGVLSIAKCFRFFRFGDRKCRFRDIAIRPNSAIATYKTYVFSKSSNVPILKFFLVIPDTFSIPKSLTEVMEDFFSLKTRSRPMCVLNWIIYLHHLLRNQYLHHKKEATQPKRQVANTPDFAVGSSRNPKLHVHTPRKVLQRSPATLSSG